MVGEILGVVATDASFTLDHGRATNFTDSRLAERTLEENLLTEKESILINQRYQEVSRKSRRANAIRPMEDRLPPYARRKTPWTKIKKPVPSI